MLVFLKVSGGSEFLFTYLNLPLSHAPLLTLLCSGARGEARLDGSV